MAHKALPSSRSCLRRVMWLFAPFWMLLSGCGSDFSVISDDSICASMSGSIRYTDEDGDDWGVEPWCCAFDEGLPEDVNPADSRICLEPDLASARNGDCDDTDPGRHPNATETCDGVDEDCDELIDEDASDAVIWYSDADGDGFGDVADPSFTCDVPTDGTLDSSDCDDTDAAVNPDATELCGDEIDNDCNGTTDDPEAGSASSWFADVDGDGFGDPEQALTACDRPDGYVEDDQDCDDGDPEIHPGALESCDGVDQDCDGAVEESFFAEGFESWLPGDAMAGGCWIDSGSDLVVVDSVAYSGAQSLRSRAGGHGSLYCSLGSLESSFSASWALFDPDTTSGTPQGRLTFLQAEGSGNGFGAGYLQTCDSSGYVAQTQGPSGGECNSGSGLDQVVSLGVARAEGWHLVEVKATYLSSTNIEWEVRMDGGSASTLYTSGFAVGTLGFYTDDATFGFDDLYLCQ